MTTILENKTELYLCGEPLYVSLLGEYIFRENMDAHVRIEHKEGEKVKAFVELQLKTIGNEEVTMLQSVTIVKSFAHKKFRKELQASLNEFFQGKLIETSSEENFQYGSFYHGTVYEGSTERPRKVIIKKMDLVPYLKTVEGYLYIHENKVFDNRYYVTRNECPNNQDPLRDVKIYLNLNNTNFYSEKDWDVETILVGDKQMYYQVGKILV